MTPDRDEPAYTFRDLATLDDFQRVFELEKRVWDLGSGDDAVPVNLFAATAKRGAILVGAFDAAGALAGFVYSLPGLKGGRLVHWSHMLGVDAPHRRHGVGRRLKLEQRARALAQGIGLVEWTFDPLQVANARLNLTVLGAEASEYIEDVYGPSESPLHAGAPTDRLVAEWDLARPGGTAPRSGGGDAATVNAVGRDGEWVVCRSEVDLASEAATVLVRVPPSFTSMLSRTPALATAWRLSTRQIFKAYFGRGYRAVAFDLDEDGGGSYRLVRRA